MKKKAGKETETCRAEKLDMGEEVDFGFGPSLRLCVKTRTKAVFL